MGSILPELDALGAAPEKENAMPIVDSHTFTEELPWLGWTRPA